MNGTNAIWHHLEEMYPDGQIDLALELQLLKEHDRIIFQFPFYWYKCPSTFKIMARYCFGACIARTKRKRARDRFDDRSCRKRVSIRRKRRIYDFRILRPYQRIANKLMMSFYHHMSCLNSCINQRKKMGTADCVSTVFNFKGETYFDESY